MHVTILRFATPPPQKAIYTLLFPPHTYRPLPLEKQTIKRNPIAIPYKSHHRSAAVLRIHASKNMVRPLSLFDISLTNQTKVGCHP
jgi:hypothetical protein